MPVAPSDPEMTRRLINACWGIVPASAYVLYSHDGRVIAVTTSEAASFAARRLLRPEPKS